MGLRRKGRELALQALYQLDVGGEDSGGALRLFWSSCDAPSDARAFGQELVAGVLEARLRIDELISKSSSNWRVERLSHVDRNILRVAAYELLCRRDIPASVAIDEAIEIAKRYGSDESPTFVNGVLDAIAAAVGAKERQRAV
ncbi:MAG: transcription antitermination factor NusB [Polyangiaceae bacterium UTPRO1]|jgi:N utilization substance protein B|nr:transcription antitermination factor NusB [Myxococcales bacterium]OQY64628.1 MAG: transcription antitermination factor NusB [Polyangiaceae bacterium UTPRO1]